jgi:1-acyl-sn-glycerol-3-phosphate acyltransferase
VLTGVRHFNVPDIGRRRGGLLIASNHQSFLDPMLVGMALPGPICYLARRSLFRTPGFGALLRAVGVHPVRRGAVDAGALKAVLRMLRRGGTVVMFPEGTRSRDGTLGRFKTGAAAIALRCGVPLLPVCVEGAYECWPRTRLLPRPGRVAVAFGKELAPGDGTADELTRRLRAEIEELRASLRRYLGRETDRGRGE